jgi:putative transposase
MSIDARALFDLEQARPQEAQRRLEILGDLISAPKDRHLLQARSRKTGVPSKTLQLWLLAFQSGGEAALLPDWRELEPSSQESALAKFRAIEPFIDAATIGNHNVAALARRLDRSIFTAQRLLKRYQAGGVWGLAPEYNPFKRRSLVGEDADQRDLGALTEDVLATIYRRHQLLGELAVKASTTEAEVAARSKEVGVARSTLWGYLASYRKYGLVGLAPKQRADKGELHGLTERMIDLVRSLRLSNKDWSVQSVFKAAQVKANELQEPAPSLWQVRQIIAKIPLSVLLVADGRENEFRNLYRFTAPINREGVIYQIDHCRIDLLVIDMRQARDRKNSGEIRCWLTVVMDSLSRYVIAFKLSYEEPNRHTVASAIRLALISMPGGVPKEIWVDHGKDFESNHVYQLTKEMDIALHFCPPHQPQIKGIIERFFGTLNTRLWSSMRGYVSSNTTLRNPTAKASLTISQIEQKLTEFLEMYHQEVHSETKMSPAEYWATHCLAMPADERRLDVLLLEPTRRKVIKQGIKFDNRVYWHADLAQIVGEEVSIRADTRYETPDEIEVYFQNRWLCTAFALDSARGRAISREETTTAQRSQRQRIRRTIDEGRAIQNATDAAISPKTPEPSTSGCEDLAASMEQHESQPGQRQRSTVIKRPSRKETMSNDDFLFAKARQPLKWNDEKESAQ